MADRSERALGRRVKELREAAGLTQQDLAYEAGLSISVVSLIEQGAKRDPRLSTVLALAQALGVSVADLLVELPAEPKRRRRKRKSV